MSLLKDFNLTDLTNRLSRLPTLITGGQSAKTFYNIDVSDINQDIW